MSKKNGTGPRPKPTVYMVHVGVTDPEREKISSIWDNDLRMFVLPTIMGIFDEKTMAEDVLLSLLKHERVPMGAVIEMPMNAFRAVEDIL